MDTRDQELEWQRRIVERARQGDEDSGWLALRALLMELDRAAALSPLFPYVADFVEGLLEVKDDAGSRTPGREELAKVLDRLYIIAGHGRPGLTDQELLGRLAAEKLETLKAGNVKDGRARLRTGRHRLGELRQRDIRTKRPDLADLVDGASKAELEGLADNLPERKKNNPGFCTE